jgi:hypothetical protein
MLNITLSCNDILRLICTDLRDSIRRLQGLRLYFMSCTYMWRNTKICF